MWKVCFIIIWGCFQTCDASQESTLGSILLSVLVKFYMKAFEHQALSLAPLKPSCFFSYISDTFVGHWDIIVFLESVYTHGPLVEWGQFISSSPKESHSVFISEKNSVGVRWGQFTKRAGISAESFWAEWL